LPFAARWKALPMGTTVILPARTLMRMGIETPAAPGVSAAHSEAQPAFVAALPEEMSPVEHAAPVKRLAIATTRTADGSHYSSEIQSNRIGAATGTDLGEAGQAANREGTATAAQGGPVSVLEIAWLLYLGVTGALLMRMLFGMATAIRIWQRARPVEVNALTCVGNLRVRASRAVASPVTIGSGIVLPAEYAEWDAEKLRIVLAHEGSHIRQRDFYLQLLAGLHAIVFWFSPLGWWLKRRLSDLAEAISDRAGLCEAASRSAYAQVLLEFAARPHPTHLGVAMAREGSISRRIDRVLNDNVFQQAFAASRTRIAAAVLLVPAAVFAATALVRVQAAAQTTPPPPPAVQAVPAPAAAPQAAPASTDAIPAPAAPAVSGDAMPEVAPPPPPAMGPIHVVVPEMTVTVPEIAPMPPMPKMKVVVPKISVVVPKIAPMPPMPKLFAIAKLDQMRMVGPIAYSLAGPRVIVTKNGAFAYRMETDGNAFVLVKRNGGTEQFSDEWARGHEEDIAKASKLAHGDFLWFAREGKSYYIDDPATVASVEAAMDAMQAQQKELAEQQEALGRQQEDMAKRQAEMMRRQMKADMRTPEMEEQIAKAQAALAELKAKQGQTMSTEEWEKIQAELAELQGRMGAMRGEMGAKMAELGDAQGKFGARQGELGAAQGRLGEKQGRLAMEMQKKVQSVIDQSMQNGKAHPVQ
ncbi:MAG TPA: M56 family metallopeptidase, partial [Terracidiphilus sp.]|nr:M56 family metallopeptidase [Terracidiphilus sp.]